MHFVVQQRNANKAIPTMRLNATVLCFLLFSIQRLAIADDVENDLVAEPTGKGTTKEGTVITPAHVQPENVDKIESNASASDGVDEANDDVGGSENDEDETTKEVPVPTEGKGKVVPSTMDTNERPDIPDRVKAKPVQPVVTTVETPESDEEPDHESNGQKFIDSSKEVGEKLYNAISGIATTNITIDVDAWKNQTWANKTPREVVDIIEREITMMFHDKYVHFIIITMSLLSIWFTLYVVQQIIENPNGALSKFCRCTIACLRILCCPIYTILCCPCCASKKNRPNTKEYSHLPLHDDAIDSKKN